jgi:uncharacterized C2H2 Zn-finger protein
MVKKGKIYLKCRRCKYKWTPDANRWRNTHGVYDRESPKMLKCPSCGITNIIPQDILKLILKQRRCF